MMRQITKNEALYFAVGGPILFWLLASFADPQILRNLFNALSLGVCVMVTVVWFVPMLEEIRQRGNESDAGGWVIVLGVFNWAFTLAWQRVYAIVALGMGRPPWLVDSAIAAFVPFSIMWGGFLFLLAPGMISASTSRNKRGLLYIACAAFIGGFAAGYVGTQTLPF